MTITFGGLPFSGRASETKQNKNTTGTTKKQSRRQCCYSLWDIVVLFLNKVRYVTVERNRNCETCCYCLLTMSSLHKFPEFKRLEFLVSKSSSWVGSFPRQEAAVESSIQLPVNPSMNALTKSPFCAAVTLAVKVTCTVRSLEAQCCLPGRGGRGGRGGRAHNTQDQKDTHPGYSLSQVNVPMSQGATSLRPLYKTYIQFIINEIQC